MESLWITLAITLAVLAGWLITRQLNAERIRAYITERGGTVVSCDWQAKSRGGHGPARKGHYRVRYADSGGRLHEASCHTRLFASVYFTHDEIVGTHGLPVQFVSSSNPEAPDAALDQNANPVSRVQIADVEREVRRLRKRMRDEARNPPQDD